MIYFMKVNFTEDNCNIVNSGQFNMDYDIGMLDFAIENKIKLCRRRSTHLTNSVSDGIIIPKSRFLRGKNNVKS